MWRSDRPELPPFLLALVATIGVVVLAALHVQIPPVIEWIAAAAAGIGGGVITPGPRTATGFLEEPAPAPAPARIAPTSTTDGGELL